MAKLKRRQLVVPPANRNCDHGYPELDLPGEDSWVLVKKQKVNILIPPLPSTKQSTMPDGGRSQLEQKPQKTSTNSPCPTRTSLELHSISDIENSMSLSPERAIPTAQKVSSSQPILTSPQPFRPGHMNCLERPQVSGFKCDKALRICSTSKVSKRSMSFLDQGVLLNQRLRALNLERKLQRAGGLSSWLISLGLDRFVKIFQGKHVNKFMLAHLTMKKLKDMGAFAVGPRRKLMHAIECLCHPYCFEARRML